MAVNLSLDCKEFDEYLVDTYQEALEIRKQFVKEIEENLNL